MGLFIALCGTACGNLFLTGLGSGSSVHSATTFATLTAVATPMPAERFLVSRSGSGNAALGTFQLHGSIIDGISCTGHGHLELTLNGMPTVGTQCPVAGEGDAATTASSGRTRLAVRAPSRVRWKISIYERAGAPTK